MALGVFAKDTTIWFKFCKNGALYMFTAPETEDKTKIKRNIRIKIAAMVDENE